MDKRYSVLTFIFGNYEIVHEIIIKDPEAEYILVTDNRDLKSSTWDIVYYDGNENDLPFDKVCYVRYHPFEFCNTDICIKVDGSVIVKDSLKPITDKFIDGGYDMSLMIHPLRNRFDVEFNAWVKLREYPKQRAEQILSIFDNMGYDINYKGLYQLSYAIQKNDNINKNINDVCYMILRMLGEGGHVERVDQIPFSMVMNKCFSNVKVMPVSEDIYTHSKYFSWCCHNSNQLITRKTKDVIEPYLFNNKTNTVNF